MDQAERIERLRLNPTLQAYGKLSRAVDIFNKISQWKVTCQFRPLTTVLIEATVHIGTPARPAPVLFKLLDQDIFSKIDLAGKKGRLICTVQEALDDDALYTRFCAIHEDCEDDRWHNSGEITFTWHKFEEIPEPTQVGDEPQVLERCEIVEFSLQCHPDFDDWVDGKTFGGITFSFRTRGSRELVSDVWPDSAERYQCPANMIDRYIKALGEAIQTKCQTLNDLVDPFILNGPYLSFGPVIKNVTKKPGFHLRGPEPKLYYADQVPWEELANQKVQVKL